MSIDPRISATGGNRYKLAELPQTGAPDRTSTSTAALVDDTYLTYQQYVELGPRVEGVRRQALNLRLEERTRDQAKRSHTSNLAAIGELGFAWRDVARALGVSVPAINKWRRGDGITGENRLKIARLKALLDTLEHLMVTEPASWLEMPIKREVAVTPLDLLAKDRYDLVLELASTTVGAGAPDPILDEYDPEWRSKFVDNAFESFTDEEGVVAIRPKGMSAGD